MLETKLTRGLTIQYPIFQAPMAGGPDRPFGVNLFVPEQQQEPDEAVFEMTDFLNQYRL